MNGQTSKWPIQWVAIRKHNEYINEMFSYWFFIRWQIKLFKKFKYFTCSHDNKADLSAGLLGSSSVLHTPVFFSVK